MMPNKALRRMVEGAVIAALYTALTLVLAPISFGPFQCRVSEVLTILPIFTPAAIPGLTLGCILSNAVGAAMGTNILGILDIFVGSAATLLAAVCTYLLRNVCIKGVPVLATLPPVVFNVLFIGTELSLALGHPLWFSMIVEVGLGEAAASMVLGIPLAAVLIKSGAQKRIFAQLR